jgi:hypothetical protein
MDSPGQLIQRLEQISDERGRDGLTFGHGALR